MGTNSQIALVIVFFSIIACSPSKRMLQASNTLQNNSNILEKIDSLIGSYNGTPEECIKLLSLASHTNEYLPNGNLFHKMNLLQYVGDNGEILECVADQAIVGNIEAERVLVDYLKSYYEKIVSAGSYSDPSPFLYLGYARNTDSIDFLYKLAVDRSECIYDGHSMLSSPLLWGIAQSSILSRIRVDGLPISDEVFSEQYSNYNSGVNKVDVVERWQQVFLPFINDAEKMGILSYAKYGEEIYCNFPMSWFTGSSNQ